MNPIHVNSIDDPRLDDYRNVRDADLLGRRGVFMAEGRLVVRALLTASRLKCKSVLATPVGLGSIGDALAASGERPAVYVVQQEVMNGVAGFDVHRGCLAVGERPSAIDVERVLREHDGDLDQPRLVVVLDDLTNHDNVGGVFRSALAMGASGVLLSPGCCDPLYRKAIRVSMGAALRLAFARVEPWAAGLAVLRERGFTVAALTPGDGAVDLDEYAARAVRPRRIALVVGAEGEGVSAAALGQCTARLRIAMVDGVDSLNASVAAAVAMHRLGPLSYGAFRGSR